MVAEHQPWGSARCAYYRTTSPLDVPLRRRDAQATYATKSTSMLSAMLRELFGRCGAKVGRHTSNREGYGASNCTRQGLRQTTRAGTNQYQLFPTTRLQLRPAGYSHPSTAPPSTKAGRSPQGHRLYASPGFTGGQVATPPALPGSNHLPEAYFTPVRSTG